MRVSHFVTDGSETVGIREGTEGNQCGGKA